MYIPRPEYPRPQFVRKEWLNLNGPWEFAFDDADMGEREGWWAGDRPLDRTIVVPFAYQAPLSGIGDRSFHDVVWYRRTFTVPPAWAGLDLLVHFGAVDYRAKVWVNGRLAATHEGGHTPFSADITHLVRPGENVVVVLAEDPSTDLTIPRGKQYWKEQSAGIFYTRTTGIWQTVWLEPVPPVRLHRVRMTPDIAAPAVDIEAYVHGFRPGLQVRVEVRSAGEAVAAATYTVLGRRTCFRVNLPEGADRDARLWTPERPHLFDITFTLTDPDGAVLDRVESYFGLRQVGTGGGRFLLNNRPYYLKLVLDQGYWPESLLTPPSDEAIRRDIELAKAMGFNGVRKHQKVEDPRFLYWADRLGLLVWGEIANAYRYTDEAVVRITREWCEVIERDYNHPCIVAWVPINESWGVPHLLQSEAQRHHLLALYHLIKSLDSTRPVSTNDGWEQPLTDLLAVHDYAHQGEVLRARYGGDPAEATRHMPAGRFLYLPGYGHRGEPLLITEFGGIAFKKSEWEGWGYQGATDEDDFVRRYRDLVQALFDCPAVAGWCYTQLTDVEQEINGLLTYDRRPKVDPEIIRQINRG